MKEPLFENRANFFGKKVSVSILSEAEGDSFLIVGQVEGSEIVVKDNIRLPDGQGESIFDLVILAAKYAQLTFRLTRGAEAHRLGI